MVRDKKGGTFSFWRGLEVMVKSVDFILNKMH